jgi:hypothetical protein
MTTLFFSLLLAHDPANSTSHVALTPWSEAGSYGSDALSRLAAAHNACQYSEAVGGGGGEVKVTRYLGQAAKFGLEMAGMYWRGEKRLRGEIDLRLWGLNLGKFMLDYGVLFQGWHGRAISCWF